MLSRLDLPRISGDEDATALTATVRLADICTGSPLTAIGLEVPVAMCREGLVTWFPCIVAVPGPRGVLALRPTFLWPAETHSTSTPGTFKAQGTEMAAPFLACLSPGARLTHSAGRHQVRGKKLYSVG